jgi:hypothetical protein
MHVSSVGKPLVSSVTLKYMKGFTLDRNPVNVNNEGSPSLIPVPSNAITLTLERNPMNVSNVGKASVLPVTFKYMKGITVERNLIHVISVGKFSYIQFLSEDIIGLTLDINCKYRM